MRIILLSFLAVLTGHGFGKFFNFYDLIWEYDSLVHILGGIFAGSLGLFFAQLLYRDEIKKYYFYSLCNAFAVGMLWETWQYSVLGARYPVSDTATDLIMDLLGGFLVACFVHIRSNKPKLNFKN